MNLFTPHLQQSLNCPVGARSCWSACSDDEHRLGEHAGSPGPLVDSDEVIAIRKRKLRILVVDDHDYFRSSLVYHLREVYNAEVQEAESGKGALEIAGSGFDLILMDIKMPGSLDGLDACAEIGRLSLAVQVVLMTAEATPERRERAAALGVRVLSKPLDYGIIERILLGCKGGSSS